MPEESPVSSDPTRPPEPAELADRQQFADLLTQLRVRAGLTVREVAKKARVPHSTVGGYLAGRHLPPVSQPDVLPNILRACGVTDGETLARWCEALERMRRLPGPRPAAASAPYRGLASFQPEDADWFFGRSRLTALVLERLRESARARRPMALVGPSGSGKSSLLRAGVIPAIRAGVWSGADRWPVLLLTPGQHPLRALAEELATLAGDSADVIAGDLLAEPYRCANLVARAAPGLVVVVDQFEEVFTECADEQERRAFLAALHAAAIGGPASANGDSDQVSAAVLLGLRADFYHRALRQPLLVEVLQSAQVAIGPMSETELREAIVAPARKAGLDVEDGLVEVLLRDVAPPAGDGGRDNAHEAGALPLLSHALRATWERGTRWRMTLADYQASGGVRGAVAHTADAVFESLTPQEQQAARRLFVRLVRVSEDAPSTRRHVARTELEQDASEAPIEGLADVLNRFVEQRLITVDADTVQITHESLVAAWPRLRAWIEADRRGLLLGQQLADAAQQWQRDDRDPAVLYRGARLAAVRDWTEDDGGRALSRVAREFLDASIRRERRRVRALYQTVAALVILLLLAVSGGAYALHQRGEALSQRTVVAQERNLALSRMVAVRADRLRESDPALASQLALAAYQIAPTVEARSSLLSSSAVPAVTRLLGPNAIMQDIALAPGPGLLAAASDDEASVWLWDVSDPRLPALLSSDLPGLTGVINAVAFHPDGRILAAAGADQVVHLYDLADAAAPTPLGTALTGPLDTVHAVEFSPDGQVLAAGTMDGSVHLWEVDVSGSRPATPASEPIAAAEASITSMAFSPDGQILAVAAHDAMVHRWDLTEPGQPSRLGEPLGGPERVVYSIAFSPDGGSLAGASADENVYLWSTADPAPDPIEVLASPAGSGWVHSVAFSPDGRSVAAGSGDGQARVWDLATGQLSATLPHPGPVTGLAFEPAGEAVYAAAADGVIRRWALPGPVLTDAQGTVFDLAHHPLAPIVVAASGDGHLYLWDVSDPQRPDLLGPPIASPEGDSALVGTVGISPDGTTLAASGRDGRTWRWDITDPRRPRMVEPALPELPTFAESLVFSPDGTLLAGGGTDGTVQLWDLADPHRPTPLATMTEGWGNVYSIAFSPDGQTLAAGAVDRVVWLWDISRPRQPRLLTEPLSGPASYVYSVAFSPDGRSLAVGSADETVRLWDLTDRSRPQPGPVLTGPTGYVLWVAYSPDGRALAAASRDHAVRVWELTDPDDPQLYAVLTGHQGGVNMLGFHPDGHTLATSSSDTTVRLWRVTADHVASQACATTGDPLTIEEWEQYVPGLPYQPPCG